MSRASAGGEYTASRAAGSIDATGGTAASCAAASTDIAR
jgi:hypothetical protein